MEGLLMSTRFLCGGGNENAQELIIMMASQLL